MSIVRFREASREVVPTPIDTLFQNTNTLTFRCRVLNVPLSSCENWYSRIPWYLTKPTVCGENGAACTKLTGTIPRKAGDAAEFLVERVSTHGGTAMDIFFYFFIIPPMCISGLLPCWAREVRAIFTRS